MAFYRAYCDKCGHTDRTGGQSPKFLTHFFLNDRCRGCGDYKEEYRNPWIVSYGDWQRKTQFKLFTPSTWISLLEWKDFDQTKKESP